MLPAVLTVVISFLLPVKLVCLGLLIALAEVLSWEAVEVNGVGVTYYIKYNIHAEMHHYIRISPVGKPFTR